MLESKFEKEFFQPLVDKVKESFSFEEAVIIQD